MIDQDVHIGAPIVDDHIGDALGLYDGFIPGVRGYPEGAIALDDDLG